MQNRQKCIQNWLIRMGSRLDNLQYQHSNLLRSYSRIEMGIFLFGALHGFAFYESLPITVAKYGGIIMTFFWIIYGFVALISASCLSELLALEPSTGETYHYCYYTICEFFAFLVGWNKIFAYSAIIVSRCTFISNFIDHIFFGDWVQNHRTPLGKKSCFGIICYKGHIDFISLILILALSLFSSWSMQSTKHLTTAIILISILILCSIFPAFLIHSDFQNIKIWSNHNKTEYYDFGETVYYGFMGYETIAVLGEEAKNPSETIPKTMITSISWIYLTYTLFTLFMSFVVTKESTFNENIPISPFYYFLKGTGIWYLSWFSNIGAFLGYLSGSYAILFINLRIMYSMSRDGMIFPLFSRVSQHSHTPIFPAMLYGSALGLFGAFIKIDHRAANFIAVFGRAFSTTCLLITRYRCENKEEYQDSKEESEKCWIIINYPHSKTVPTLTTQKISFLLIYLLVVSALSAAYCTLILFNEDDSPYYQKIIALCSLLFFIIFVACLQCQPQNQRLDLSYTVPYVPKAPAVSIILEFFLATFLTKPHWGLPLCWTLIGIIFYFAYSIHHSRNNNLLNSKGERWNPWCNKRKRKEIEVIQKMIPPASDEQLEESSGLSFSCELEEFEESSSKENEQDTENLRISSNSNQATFFRNVEIPTSSTSIATEKSSNSKQEGTAENSASIMRNESIQTLLTASNIKLVESVENIETPSNSEKVDSTGNIETPADNK